MKIRVLEIFAITLFVLGIAINHSYQNSYDDFAMVRITIPLIYFFGGYFIFKPKKEIKFGIGIAIVNGIILSVALFIALTLISHGYVNYYGNFILIELPAYALIAILILLLYKKNKTIQENYSYVKSVIIRNLILFSFSLITLLMPNKLRVILFHGTNSNIYMEVKQRECIEESDIAIDNDDLKTGIYKASEAVQYSIKRNNLVDFLYQRSLNTLGYAFYMNSDYHKADSVYTIVKQINQNDYFDINESDYDRTTYNYGLLYSSWGYYYKSDSVFYKCLNDYEYSDLSLAYIHGCLADNQNARGNYSNADSLYKITISYHEKSNFENKGSYIKALGNLGDNYSDRALYEKADSMYLSALEETKNEFGENHLNYAAVLDDLMLLYRTTAKYEKAKEYGEASLKIKQKLLGTEHSKYIYTQIKMASIKLMISEYVDAENILLQSLSSIEKHYSLKSPLACGAYDILVDLYKDYEQINKSAIYADKSLEAREEYYGTFNLNTAFSIDNKAYLYYCNNKLYEADSMYHKALRIKKYYSGRNNPSFAKSLNGLGLVISATGNLLKADTLFNYTLEILENSVGKKHPSYATALNNKAYVQIKEKQFYLAEKYFTESIEINTEIFGPSHINIAENYIGMATLKKEQKLYVAAKTNYQKALAIYIKLFKGKHPKISYLQNEILLIKG